jgi:hypothetical protein
LKKDPETFGEVHGYVLSEKARDLIGTNLVTMFDRATRGNARERVTIRDAFLTSAIGTILEVGGKSLSDDEMLSSASVVLSLLPYGRLEAAGLTGRTLRSLGKDRALLSKVQRLLQ